MADYITRAEGDTYMTKRLDPESWDDATDDNKDRAIAMATRAIDQIHYRGQKKAEAQANQFPRNDDGTVPQDIKDACAEEAVALLDGMSPQIEIENARLIQQSYGGVSATYDKDNLPEHILTGIMSIFAWRFLKPYLKDLKTVHLFRES